MKDSFDLHGLIEKYPYIEEEIKRQKISEQNLQEIYQDYIEYTESYENQADFIANILRTQKSVHSVKSRIKDRERLIEKIIRKTEDRKKKYGAHFQFDSENYKNEITDLIGIRVIHIFKEQWRDIHEFIINTWKVIEITANVREGDNTKDFENLNIEVKSRASGYRSVHYLVELNFTQSNATIAEIQVRTIFEEGYGEIDHTLRYTHKEIPEIIQSNLLLFNRIVGSADEMASLINSLGKDYGDKEKYYKQIIEEQRQEIEELKKNMKKIKNIEKKY